MEGLALTGAWVDAEKGLARDDRARDGRQLAPLRGARAGRADRPDGPDRARRPRSPRRRRCCSAAAASATPCSSRSRARSRRSASKVLYFAGYKRGEDLFKQDDIERCTDQVIWCTDSGRRDRAAPPAGRALPRQHRPGDGRLRQRASSAARRRSRSREVQRIIAIGSDGMMNAVQRGAPRRARAAARPAAPRHRQHQLADAVHDEGGLRAVPPEAARPARRARSASSSPASTRTRSSTRSTSATCASGCAPTRCRRSSSNAWLDELLKTAPDVIRV